MNDPAPASADAPEAHINPMAHVIAPLVALGATFVVRKVLDRTYQGVTGHKAPDSRDPGVSLTRALVWTAVTAATAALVEVAVYRAANSWGSHPQ